MELLPMGENQNSTSGRQARPLRFPVDAISRAAASILKTTTARAATGIQRIVSNTHGIFRLTGRLATACHSSNTFEEA